MRRFCILVAAGTLWMGAQQALAGLEARVEAIVDPKQSEQSTVGGLIGLGVPVMERLTLGGYGYLVPTDRDLPEKMTRINGAGAFAEFDLSEGYDLMPFIGARAGFLSAAGAGYGTAQNLGGSAGLKYRITERLTVAFSVNYLWASEDYYNYQRKTPTAPGDPFYKADNTDLTLNFGIRWMF